MKKRKDDDHHQETRTLQQKNILIGSETPVHTFDGFPVVIAVSSGRRELDKLVVGLPHKQEVIL